MESKVPLKSFRSQGEGCTLARVVRTPSSALTQLCHDPSRLLYNVCSGTTVRQMRNTDETGKRGPLGDKSNYIAGVFLNFI